jgi:hypothetical protein
MRKAYKIVFTKPEGDIPVERSRHNMRTVLKYPDLEFSFFLQMRQA